MATIIGDSGAGEAGRVTRASRPGLIPRDRIAAAAITGTLVLLAGPATPGWAAGTTERVSLGPGGRQANGHSTGGRGAASTISADGRFVAFESDAGNLVPGDTNNTADVFVRDRQAGRTERVSVATGGAQADGSSSMPLLSADGRFVAFVSRAANLVPGDTNGASDLFVRDRQAGTTERVRLDPGGLEPETALVLSPGGRYVAFESGSPNLGPGDTNRAIDVFVHDRQAGTTERVSVATGGRQGNLQSLFPAISAGGRFVAFVSYASNLVPGDTNGVGDVFVRDRQARTTERVSLGPGNRQTNHQSEYPAISNDGRFVAFLSFASNLVPGDTNGVGDAFVRDRQAGRTERVSIGRAGAQCNRDCTLPRLSPGGRFVTFETEAGNLVPGDTNGAYDLFLRDRQAGTTERVSVGAGGGQGDLGSGQGAVAAGGRHIAFSSASTNLVPGDTNGTFDVFVRTR